MVQKNFYALDETTFSPELKTSDMNKEILFDYRPFFRTMDYIRVFFKAILTRLRFRNKQSCKYCGRDQQIIWAVEDDLWESLPKKWHNKALCLECFVALCPKEIFVNDILILGFVGKIQISNDRDTDHAITGN